MIHCTDDMECAGPAGHAGPHWRGAKRDPHKETVTLTREELSDLLVSAALVGAIAPGLTTRGDLQRYLRHYPNLRQYVTDLEA